MSDQINLIKKNQINTSAPEQTLQTSITTQIKQVRFFERQWGEKISKSQIITVEDFNEPIWWNVSKYGELEWSYGTVYQFDLIKTTKYWRLEGKDKIKQVPLKEASCFKCKKLKGEDQCYIGLSCQEGKHDQIILCEACFYSCRRCKSPLNQEWIV